VFQEAALEPAEAARFYDTGTHVFARQAQASLSTLAHYAQEIILLRLLTRAARPQVLDYGMGWGRWASLAQAYGCEVAGVEINPEARTYCQQRGLSVLDESVIPTGHFDFIIADQVLEHLTDPLTVMRALTSWLKPGGLLLVGVPNRPAMNDRLRRLPLSRLSAADLKAVFPFIHLTLFSNRSLRLLASHAGLALFPPPFFKAVAACTLWHTLRQCNQNVNISFKFWRGAGTRLWFQRPEKINPDPATT
jgi:SAM-dependent methyltransferase